jgi:hypothetical protein
VASLATLAALSTVASALLPGPSGAPAASATKTQTTTPSPLTSSSVTLLDGALLFPTSRGGPAQDYLASLEWFADVLPLTLGEDRFHALVAQDLIPFVQQSMMLHSWPHQNTWLALLVVLMNRPSRAYKKAWLSSSDFGAQFEAFFMEKPVSRDRAQTIIPAVWWPAAPASRDRAAFEEIVVRLDRLASNCHSLREVLFAQFLSDNEPLATNIRGGTLLSPHAHLMHFLVALGPRNIPLLRQSVPPGLSAHSTLENIALACAATLQAQVGCDPVALAETLWSPDADVDDWFVNTLPVVGGDLAHVKKELNKKIAAGQLPARPAKSAANKPSASQTLLACSSLLYFLGSMDALKSILTAHADTQAALSEHAAAQARLAACKANKPEARAMLEEALTLFERDAASRLATDAIIRLLHFSSSKQATVSHWAATLARVVTLAHASPFFDFFPRHTLLNVIEIARCLPYQADQLLQAVPFYSCTPANTDLFFALVGSLAQLPGDPRIVNPDLPLELLTGLGTITQLPVHVRLLEQRPALARTLLTRVALACDQNMWLSATEVLSRLVVGRGLAFDACAGTVADATTLLYVPGTFSPLLLQEFAAMLRADNELASGFMNRVFNAIGWSVTEFDQTLDEIRLHPEHTDTRMRYRRCLRLYDVVVMLLRMLETTVAAANFLFVSGDQAQINVSRLIQMILVLLSRIANARLFGNLAEVHLIHLKPIVPSCAIAPMTSIICMLFALAGPIHSFVVKTLFEDASFSRALVVDLSTFCRGLAQAGKIPTAEAEATEQQLAAVLAAFDEKESSQQRANDSRASVTSNDDEDNTCTICYSNALSATFRPCNHRSCRLCIQRHLLNNTKCFFCNAVVERVDYDAE